MTFDDAWFNWPNLIVAITAVVIGAVGMWFTYLALFPSKKLLLHGMISNIRLLVLKEASQDIMVLHQTTPLSDPWVAQYVLVNDGRHAIRSEDFDQSRPIRINLNAKIIAALAAPNMLRWHIEGSTLIIEKDLLPRKRRYEFTPTM